MALYDKFERGSATFFKDLIKYITFYVRIYLKYIFIYKRQIINEDIINGLTSSINVIH